MTYYGDYPASHTNVVMTFDSFAAATGASSATSNFASSDILVYKDGGTTQRTSASGITVSTSFDSQTGLQLINIDLSDNTDAGFYAAGHEYQVGIADVTIDGQTVRFWLGTFSVERAGGALALIKALKSGTGVNVTQWNGSNVSVPTVAGVPNVNVKTWNDLVTVALPLVPTTAGRTLDVSAGGEAGLDWANIGSPTTVVDLSGTTIKTATDVETDTQDIQTRLPAALVGGRMDSSVGAMAANVVTATAIAADAIGASELAADAVVEIQTGLATALALAAVQADTDDIQTRIPAALTSDGLMKADALRINGNANAAATLALSAAGLGVGVVDTGSFSATVTAFEADVLTFDGSSMIPAAADHYKARIIVFTSGLLRGQATDITAYAKTGSNAHFTVSALTSAPGDNVTFVIF